MILVKRKIRDSILTFIKLEDKKYVHLSDFIKFYDDVKDVTFQNENYDKEFLEKIFFYFKENSRILERKNTFTTGSLVHKYYLNLNKKDEFLTSVECFLNTLKSVNIINKKLKKIKSFPN